MTPLPYAMRVAFGAALLATPLHTSADVRPAALAELSEVEGALLQTDGRYLSSSSLMLGDLTATDGGMLRARAAATSARTAAEQLVLAAKRENKNDAARRMVRAREEARRQASSLLGLDAATEQTPAAATAPSVVVALLQHTLCSEDCNSRGLCIGGGCVCDAGFLGATCERRRCPSDCSGRGYCFDGRCQCSGVFGGKDCSESLDAPAVVALQMEQAHGRTSSAVAHGSAAAAQAAARVLQPHLKSATLSAPPLPQPSAQQRAGTGSATPKAFPRVSWPALPSRGTSMQDPLAALSVDSLLRPGESKTLGDSSRTGAELLIESKTQPAHRYSPSAASWVQDMAKARPPQPATPPLAAEMAAAAPQPEAAAAAADVVAEQHVALLSTDGGQIVTKGVRTDATSSSHEATPLARPASTALAALLGRAAALQASSAPAAGAAPEVQREAPAGGNRHPLLASLFASVSGAGGVHLRRSL
mmetsp:Transcript_81293/g.206470  ORF Transcript_81293/g.206470 Transcript_81293/m.206470 type:complete len:476 (-) Transcript_81293:108-1535(-)